MTFEKQGPKRAYGILNLETGEKKFIFLDEKKFEEAFTYDEVQKMLTYMKAKGEI